MLMGRISYIKNIENSNPTTEKLAKNISPMFKLTAEQVLQKQQTFMEKVNQKFALTSNKNKYFYSLSEILKILTKEEITKLKRALFKQEGYFTRLFSTETWEEWCEEKTAIGKVVSVFEDHITNNISLDVCLQRLDASMLEKADNEAALFLEQQKATIQKNALPTTSLKRWKVESTNQNTVNNIPNQLTLTVGQTLNLYLDANTIFGPDAVSLGVSNLPSWLTVTAPILGASNLITLYPTQFSNNKAFVVDNLKIRVFDVSNPVAPVLLSNMTSPLGQTYNAFKIVDDRRLIIFTTSGLKFLNVSNPSLLEITAKISSTDFPDLSYVSNLDVIGSLLYVAGVTKMLIFDFSDMTSPKFICSYPKDNSKYSFSVHNNLFFTATFSQVGVYNFSNPFNQTLLGNFSLPNNNNILPVFSFQGDSIFVGNYYSPNLQILDISNPKNIKQLANFQLPNNQVLDVSVRKNTAIVTTGMYIYILDLSDQSNPQVIRVIQNYNNLFRSQFVEDNIAYIPQQNTGAVVIDVDKRHAVLTSNNNNPLLVSQAGNYPPIVLTALLANGSTVTRSIPLKVIAPPVQVLTSLSTQMVYPNSTLSMVINYAPIFSSPLPIKTLQLSATLSNEQPLPPWITLSIKPSQLSSYQITNAPSALAVLGTKSYVIDKNSNLLTFDISTPTNPVLLNNLNLGALTGFNLISALNVLGNTLFISGGGFAIVDISNFANPTLIGKLNYNGGAAGNGGISMNGNIVAAVSNGATFLLNIANSTAPTIINSNAYPWEAFDVCIFNNLLYIAANSAVQIASFKNNFTNINVIGSLSLSSNSGVKKIKVDDNNRLFVANSKGGLVIADVKNPINPIISNVFLPNSQCDIRDVYVVGNMALLADANFGLFVVDVTNSVQPSLLGSFNMPNGATRIQSDGGNLAIVLGNTQSTVNIFNLAIWAFEGAVPATASGNLDISLSAIDYLGGKVTAPPFTIETEVPPVFNSPIPSQKAKVGQLFTLFLPQGLVSSPNFHSTALAASLSDGSSLPSWLVFNNFAYTFQGTPTTNAVGSYTVVVSSTDNVNHLTAKTQFTLNVNSLPSANFQQSQIPSSFVAQRPLSISLANVFTQPDRLPLNYTAMQQNTNLPLPSWLSFDSTTLQLSGTPPSSGQFSIVVTATDITEGSVSITLTLNVIADQPPILVTPILAQYATVGNNFNIFISNVFRDQTPSYPLTYTALNLPKWANLTSGIITGTPGRGDVTGSSGVLVVLKASNNQYTSSTSFTLAVIGGQYITFKQPTQIPSVPEGKFFSYTLPADTFIDTDGLPLSISTTLDSGSPLPAGVSQSGFTISGILPAGNYLLKTTATDVYGKMLSFTWTLNIFAVQAPVVLNPISAPNAQVNTPYVFVIPSNTFSSPLNTTYSVQLSGGGSLPGWLSVNIDTSGAITLKGTPTGFDTDFNSPRVSYIAVTATNPKGSATAVFSLAVTGTSTAYTILTSALSVGSALITIFGLYKKRAIIINVWNLRHRFKDIPFTSIYAGEEVNIPFEVPPKARVRTVRAMQEMNEKSASLVKKFKCWLSNSKPLAPIKGGLLLPAGLVYEPDENNENLGWLKGTISKAYTGKLEIQVRDKFSINLVVIKLEVLDRTKFEEQDPNYMSSSNQAIKINGLNINFPHTTVSSEIELQTSFNDNPLVVKLDK